MNKSHLVKIISDEGYARISDMIVLLWGSIELDHYLAEILMDYRGNRRGFDPLVFDCLLKLYNIHTEEFGFSHSTQPTWKYK